jgi:hypothetical protein
MSVLKYRERLLINPMFAEFNQGIRHFTASGLPIAKLKKWLKK